MPRIVARFGFDNLFAVLLLPIFGGMKLIDESWEAAVNEERMPAEDAASSQSPMALDAEPQGINAIAFDIDGMPADGGIGWGADRQDFKRLCFSDIMGLSLARRQRFTLTLISGKNSPLIDRNGAKLNIPEVTEGWRDRLREFP